MRKFWFTYKDIKKIFPNKIERIAAYTLHSLVVFIGLFLLFIWTLIGISFII